MSATKDHGPVDIIGYLRSAVARLAGMPPDAVATGVPLRELGVDSAGMTRLATDISDRLGRPVPAWAVWQHPTVAALATFLAGEPGTADPAARQVAATAEPVAIVGMGCRLPGGIDSPAELWSGLLSGVDAVGPVPAGRWDGEDWFDQDPAAPGRTTSRRGGFLDDVAGFDAAFFRIAPAEADRMDPQQRVALEVAWSALEDAGVAPDRLEGSNTGVFLGTMWQEYHLATGADPTAIGSQSAVGWDTSIVPARIAYALGLRGPVLSVGTACSSSLGALHLAAHSLRRGESDLVLAGGVSLMLHPHTTIAMTKFGGLNPHGQCRAFDADAAGYVRGEGCGVVVLRRLSDALREGDRIYAVLRGSAMNNDGASNGLTAPNPLAQAEVLRAAWLEAAVAPHQVSYVETHGTGTPLGDVIEAGALGEVFARGRAEELRIGSVKTNFGHLEPAAGVLGVLKTALSLHHGELPASLHCERPNPKIDFAGQRLAVVTERQGWPEGPRYAGVSGFGFGGTNVHLALEQAPYRRRRLVALAADTERELREQVAEFLREPEADALPRGSGPYRAFAAVERQAELATALRDARRTAEPGSRPRVAFCFSGHGSQWAGMGRGLLAEPAFRAALAEADRALAEFTGWSVWAELLAEHPELERTEVVQPVLFAFQVALARTLRAWGITPDVVFGQSIGEVAAAVTAGALTLATGARIIAVWSGLVAERASGTGGVLLCELAEADAARIAGERLTVAGSLAPDRTCLSGPHDQLDTVQRELAEAGVRTQRVAIDYPSHSTGLAGLRPELLRRLGEVRPGATAVPFVSTVTAGPLAGPELDTEYWVRNMCLPMRLADAVAPAIGQEPSRIVEIAPHPVLAGPLARTVAADPWLPRAPIAATCRRDQPARQSLEDLAGLLWTDGVPVDWTAVRGGTDAGGRLLPWVLSARTSDALRDQAAALSEHLAARPDLAAADIGYTLATARASMEQRAVLLARERTGFADGLAALAAGQDAPGLVTGRAVPGAADAGPVLVFPGQGAQWCGMARELLGTAPAFAERFAECALALEPFVDFTPAEVLADDEALARVEVVQPVLWAVLVSLAGLWSAHGLRPAAVVGHSQGEIAAACVAGALSLADGARVVALRSRLVARELAGRGGMVSVALPREHLPRYLTRLTGRLALAAENGAASTVLSGEPAALEELLARCAAEEVRARRVPVDYASHSEQVGAIHAELLEQLAPIRPRPAELTFHSTVTGEPVADTGTLDAGYWYRNLRGTVEFRAAIERLAAAGHRVFIEASPHPVLTMAIEETTADLGAVAVGSLRRDDGGLARFHQSLAEAHVRGARLDWRVALPSAHRVDLPTYRFQHRRHWLDREHPAPGGTGLPEEAALWEAVDRGDVDTVRSTLDVEADGTLAELVPALAAWRSRGRDESAIRDCWYEVTWTRLPERPAPDPTGTWLVLLPARDELVRPVLDGLAGAGMDLVTVRQEPHTGREALARSCAAAAGTHRLTGVLSLLALDTGPHPDRPAVPAGYAATLLAIQALGTAAVTAPLWCLTTGAVRAESTGDPVSPSQRLVWGLGRVAALEHADRWGGLIDLPAEPEQQTWRRLAAALHRGEGEDQLAIRGNRTLARRLHRASVPAPTGWHPRGTVLITGGTGALGAHLARWAAGHGAERIVLAGRRGPDAPGAAELVAELRATGVQVLVEACDVAERDQVRELLDRIDAPGGLRTVIHAAAVLDDAVLDTLDADQVERALRVKAQGAWHLHELTAGIDLDAFVLFSSFGATVGLPGQGNYAPANAYLDALAELRQAEGLPATAVSWGAWAGAGMGRTAVAGVLERHGVPGIPPERAVLALRRAIEGGRPCQTVADVRWERFLAAFTAVRPSRLLADLPEVRRAAAAAEDPQRKGLRHRLVTLPADQRREAVAEVVLKHAAAVLGYRPGDRPEPERAFRELGFDSVTGVDLTNRLGAETGLRLPVTLVFEHPTPAAVTGHLLAELDLDEGPRGPAAAVDAVETALTGLDPAALRATDLGRLRSALRKLDHLVGAGPEPEQPTAEDPRTAEALDDVSDEDLFRFIDKKFGEDAAGTSRRAM
ncbi:type I polyketide synthase [Amycolatopsis aidingensis]|uniref:type I polyketide synthase n=1 Tax=Amycolatopsis aidingensis TaxID=2842453 RepID=UPI001C0D6F76|nr:type I polyketide synthase [Amycolatopsis aidingensis]